MFHELLEFRAVCWEKALNRILRPWKLKPANREAIITRAVGQASILAADLAVAEKFDPTPNPRGWFRSVVAKQAIAESLATAHWDEISGYVANRLHRPKDDPDVEDIMLKLLERVVERGNLRDVEKCRAYLYGVASNLVLEYFRTINQDLPTEKIDGYGTPGHADDTEIRLRQEDAIARAIVQIMYPRTERFLVRAVYIFGYHWTTENGKLPQTPILELLSLTQPTVSRKRKQGWQEFCRRIRQEVAGDPVLCRRLPTSNSIQPGCPAMPAEEAQLLALMFTATERLCQKSEEHMQVAWALWWGLRAYPATGMFPAHNPLPQEDAVKSTARLLKKPIEYVQQLAREASETWEALLGEPQRPAGGSSFPDDGPDPEPLCQWREYARQRLRGLRCVEVQALLKTLVARELRQD